MYNMLHFDTKSDLVTRIIMLDITRHFTFFKERDRERERQRDKDRRQNKTEKERKREKKNHTILVSVSSFGTQRTDPSSVSVQPPLPFTAGVTTLGNHRQNRELKRCEKGV